MDVGLRWHLLLECFQTILAIYAYVKKVETIGHSWLSSCSNSPNSILKVLQVSSRSKKCLPTCPKKCCTPQTNFLLPCNWELLLLWLALTLKYRRQPNFFINTDDKKDSFSPLGLFQTWVGTDLGFRQRFHNKVLRVIVVMVYGSDNGWVQYIWNLDLSRLELFSENDHRSCFF